MRLVKKFLVILQVGLQLWVPAFLLFWSVSRPLPAWADKFLDAARQGQNLGQNLIPDPSTLANQGPGGEINLNWQGKTSTFKPEDLFPDQKNTIDPNAAEAFGNDAQVVNRAQSETENMATSPSMTGEAYRTLRQSANRARVNMSNDPIWGQTDDVITQVLNGTYGNCQVITTSSTATSEAHVPDYRTCERVKYPGGTCKCYHGYTVELIGQYGVTVGALTDDDAHISVNLLTGAVSCWGEHGVSNCALLTPLPPSDICATSPEGVTRAITTPYTNGYFSGVEQAPTCSNMTATMYVHNTPGSHSYEWRTASLMVNVYHIVDRGWTCDPGCEVILSNVHGDHFIRPSSYNCSMGPCDQCTSISGAYVCEGHLYATNPFASIISGLAHQVTINLEDFNQGPMDCWTDPQGAVHCPENPGDRHDTCAALENDPTCSYIGQQCIEGAQDPDSGICYAWDVKYDCGTNVAIEDPQTTMAYVCDGVIRCMGEECINGQFDLNNNGFARAAALLQAVQYASSDADCGGSETDCKIFTGKQYSCKKALGGWVDCCVEPEGVSLVSYIETVAKRVIPGVSFVRGTPIMSSSCRFTLYR